MLENPTALRLIPFVTILCTMLLWETLAPRRTRVESRSLRTLHNLLLTVVNSLALKLVPILSAVGAASLAEDYHVGLLHWIDLPIWLDWVLAIVLFDLLIYWQHVAAHHVPMLWMVHRVHHADHDLDASSGLRFHPLEILFSMLVKTLGAIVLGAPPEAILLFEIILNGCALFNHSNIHLPLPLERFLRVLIVTPDMHRIHHSVERDETNSNYGFNIAVWDRLFGTYRDQPRGDQATLKLGLPEYPDARQTMPVWAMLMMPFRTPMLEAEQATGDLSQLGPGGIGGEDALQHGTELQQL